MSLTERHVRRPSLPTDQPTLVMLGSDNPKLLHTLDRLLHEAASRLDLRSNALWTEVRSGHAFLQTVIETMEGDLDQVRFAFAAPHATVQELLRHALLASSLDLLSLHLDLGPAKAPHYQVCYQPIVSLSDRSIIGFESLIRAKSGSEAITADDLINRAVAGGWIAELDSLGRSLAIEGVGPWLGEGLLFLNVMAPGGSFDEKAVLGTIMQAKEAGLAPDQLVLEAVERNRYSSMTQASEQVEGFRQQGVRIAVDDVGDGYSSLRKVVSFKPDIVKIAGSLAKDLDKPEGKAVVRSIVELAHETGAWVVAENIETAAQAQQARDLSVDWGQGHFFGAPGLP